MARVSQRNSTVLRAVERQVQMPLRHPDAIEVPWDYQIERAERCRSLGMAIEACAIEAGLDVDKQVSEALGYDKAQLSRWQSGAEGIKSEKLLRIQQWCGNYIPLLWLIANADFDPRSLRKRETRLERENRLLREENAALRRSMVTPV